MSCDKKLTERIADGLSEMDKTAEIQRDKKGNIIYDKETRDTEIVKYTEDIETYMFKGNRFRGKNAVGQSDR